MSVSRETKEIAGLALRYGSEKCEAGMGGFVEEMWKSQCCELLWNKGSVRMDAERGVREKGQGEMWISCGYMREMRGREEGISEQREGARG